MMYAYLVKQSEMQENIDSLRISIIYMEDLTRKARVAMSLLDCVSRQQ